MKRAPLHSALFSELFILFKKTTHVCISNTATTKESIDPQGRDPSITIELNESRREAQSL
jgi:hypothetical protein